MRRVTGILFILLAMSPAHARAEDHRSGYMYFISTETLERRCNSDLTREKAFCEGYVAGVADALNNTNDHHRDARNFKACEGKTLSLRESAGEVGKLMKWVVEDGIISMPASRFVVATFGTYICDDSEARRQSIREQIGEPPPRGSPRAAAYNRMVLCMDLFSLPKDTCMEMAGEE